jgi:hypothetical protein
VTGDRQVERAVVAAGGDARALAAARNHLGNHFADRRQWAQVRSRARARGERPAAALVERRGTDASMQACR